MNLANVHFFHVLEASIKDGEQDMNYHICWILAYGKGSMGIPLLYLPSRNHKSLGLWFHEWLGSLTIVALSQSFVARPNHQQIQTFQTIGKKLSEKEAEPCSN